MSALVGRERTKLKKKGRNKASDRSQKGSGYTDLTFDEYLRYIDDIQDVRSKVPHLLFAKEEFERNGFVKDQAKEYLQTCQELSNLLQQTDNNDLSKLVLVSCIHNIEGLGESIAKIPTEKNQNILEGNSCGKDYLELAKEVKKATEQESGRREWSEELEFNEKNEDMNKNEAFHQIRCENCQNHVFVNQDFKLYHSCDGGEEVTEVEGDGFLDLMVMFDSDDGGVSMLPDSLNYDELFKKGSKVPEKYGIANFDVGWLSTDVIHLSLLSKSEKES